jgi:hypothetical protein
MDDEKYVTFSEVVSCPSESAISAPDPLTWRQMQLSTKGTASSVSTGMSTDILMLHLPVKLSTTSYTAILKWIYMPVQCATNTEKTSSRGPLKFMQLSTFSNPSTLYELQGYFPIWSSCYLHTMQLYYRTSYSYFNLCYQLKIIWNWKHG